MGSKSIESKEDIDIFLNDVRKYLKESSDNLYIPPRADKENDKTFLFMVENNLSHETVCNHLISLTSSNYSYTDDDYNPKYVSNVRIFGLLIPDSKTEIYIKLKIRSQVICLSFHEAQYPIGYPYPTL